MFGPNVDVLDELRRGLPSRYTIDTAIGSGGQGSVFRGTVDGVPAAVKVFLPTTDRRRVDREIELLQKINCPSLVRVLAVDSIQILGLDVSVIAYELHPGGDLRDSLDANEPALDGAQLAKIGLDVGAALDALWAQRIVHRDVKPANVVRAADDRLVLVDVGLARHVDRSAISGPGVVSGTSGYMSPEHATGRRNLTIHADAFSLGVTLYHLAAKTHPFGGQQALIVQRWAPKPLRTLRGDLPEGLLRAIDRLLAFRPSGRPRALAQEFVNL